MKRLYMLIALAIAISTTMQAQIINDRNTDELRFSDEYLIISPDTLRMFFYGCSPYGERMSIINITDNFFAIDRFYSDAFHIECFEDGVNIAESGTILPPGDTLEIQVFGSPLRDMTDIYGVMYMETDSGLYSVTLDYITNVGIDEFSQTIGVYPNPADNFVTISGNSLGKITIYNTSGQMVDEFYTNDNTFKINTSVYKNGVYSIKADTDVTRIIVNHK